MFRNQIIMRGMAAPRNDENSPGLVTSGFGNNSVLAFVLEQVDRIVRIGRSGAKRVVDEVNEVVVWAKLIRVNNDINPPKIIGNVRTNSIAHYAITLTEFISSRTRKTWEDVKISIQRLK